MRLPELSDFIVYADESGDHGMVSIDPQYPVFALTFCVMRKTDYTAQVVPALQQFKFGIWGHDSVVLHEHEIRKSMGPFAILRTDRDLRGRFFDGLNALIEAAPMTIFASVIDKERHRVKYANPWNPYEIALHFCMERLHLMMTAERQHGKSVHVIFESRGPKEDDELKLEFRRIVGNDSHWGYRRHDFSRFDFQPVFIPKAANSAGLQLADLTARPPSACRACAPTSRIGRSRSSTPSWEGSNAFPKRLHRLEKQKGPGSSKTPLSTGKCPILCLLHSHSSP